jgi:hypothetical protein
MNYDNVVRKFKGYYFLNKRYNNESWGVKKIQLSKGQLVISTISTKQDIENLMTITESPKDTAALYKFAPALDNSLKHMQKINRLEIAELRSMKHPPRLVKLVMAAICILLDVEPV